MTKSFTSLSALTLSFALVWNTAPGADAFSSWAMNASVPTTAVFGSQALSARAIGALRYQTKPAPAVLFAVDREAGDIRSFQRRAPRSKKRWATLLLFVGAWSGAQAQSVREPVLAHPDLIEQTQMALVADSDVKNVWETADESTAGLASLQGLLARSLRTPEVQTQFYNHRADWSHLLALLRHDGKDFTASSIDSHALRNRWYGSKFPDFRDTWGFTGLSLSDPKQRVNTYGMKDEEPAHGGWIKRLAHGALSLFLEAASGVQMASKNVAEKAWLEDRGQVMEINEASARLHDAAATSYVRGLDAWFTYTLQNALVAQREAERALADHRVRNLQALEREGFGDAKSAGGSQDLTIHVLQLSEAELDDAKQAQEDAWRHLLRQVAIRPDDLAKPESLSRPRGPEWTFQAIDENVAHIDQRLASLIASEAYDGTAEEDAKKDQAPLRAEDPPARSDFDSVDLYSWPALDTLFLPVPEDTALGTSPHEQALLLHNQALITVQEELIKLREKTTWEVGFKFQAATTPLLASFLNWNVNKPSPTTKLSVKDLIAEVDLQVKAVKAEIAAEQIRVRAAFLQARSERRKAFIALQHTRTTLALLQGQAADTTLDREQIALEIEVVHRRSEVQVLEALAAWKKMQFYTPMGQQVVDQALESHYVNALEALGSPAAQVPDVIHPSTPNTSSVPSPARPHRWLSRIAPLIPLIAGGIGMLTSFASGASASTFTSVSSTVATSPRSVNIGVAFESGDTLSAIALKVLNALHPEHTGRFAQSEIWNTVYRIADLNGLAHTRAALDHFRPTDTVNIGSFDLATAERLTGTPLHVPSLGAAVSHAASAVTPSVSKVAMHLAHPAFWTDPMTWAWVIGGGVVVIAAFWWSRRVAPAVTRRWLLPVAASLLALVGLASTSSELKALASSKRAAVFQGVKNEAHAVKNKFSTVALLDYAVSVRHDRAPILLPYDSGSPGVISSVNRHASVIAAGQAVVALDPLPYENLRREINQEYSRLHPGQGVLLEESLLGTPDASRAPIRVRTDNLGDSTGAKIREGLFALKQTLVQYAYAKEVADRNGAPHPTPAERALDEMVTLQVRHLKTLSQERALSVVRATRSVHLLPGTLIQSGTLVNHSAQEAVTLYKVQDRTLLGLGLPPAQALALSAAAPSSVLKFIDQKGKEYVVPVEQVRQITEPNGVVSRGKSGAEPKTNAYDRSMFGPEATVYVEMEFEQSPFPVDVVPAFKGIYKKASDEQPIRTEIPADSMVSVQLSVDRDPVRLRHGAKVPFLNEELSVIRDLQIKNRDLRRHLNELPKTDNASLNAAVLQMMQEIDRRQVDLEKAEADVEAERTALDRGVSDTDTTSQNQVVVPTEVSSNDEASTLSRELPASNRADERQVFKKGDDVDLVATGDVLLGPDLPNGKRQVYLPSIDETLTFTPMDTENADQRYRYPKRSWEGVFQLGRDLPLEKFKRLFRGLPTNKAVTYGLLQRAPLKPSGTWDTVLSYAREAGHGIVSSGHSFWKSLITGLAVVFVGMGVIFQSIRRTRIQQSSTFADPHETHADRSQSHDLKVILSTFKGLRERVLQGEFNAPTESRGLARLADPMIRISSNRLHQNRFGGWMVVILSVVLFYNIPLFEALIRGLLMQSTARELAPMTPMMGFDAVFLVVYVAAVPYLSAPQRSGELWVNVTVVLRDILVVLNMIVTLPVRLFRGIRDLHRHQQVRHQKANRLDNHPFLPINDFAVLGRFFTQVILLKIESDPALATAVLSAFQTYNVVRPDRKRPGAGPLELISPEETRSRLERAGQPIDALTPEDLEKARARYTIWHVQSRNSLAIPAFLALVRSALINDALPPKEGNEELWTEAGKALTFLVKTDLFPDTFRPYRRAFPDGPREALSKAA